MIKDTSQANTKEDIIALILPGLLTQIPSNNLDKIGERILLEERIQRQVVLQDLLDIIILINYSPSKNRISQIEYRNAVYKP